MRSFECEGSSSPAATAVAGATICRSRARSLADVVRARSTRFQALHQAGRYRIVFFVNMAPRSVQAADRFVDGGRWPMTTALLEVLGRGTPAVSSAARVLALPSVADAGSRRVTRIGNANLVKAEALFRYLRDRVLPPLLPAAAVKP